MIRIAFVILHYEAVGDTVECLDSLKKYLSENVHVIVVDNGSKHGKISGVINEYSQIDNIVFLRSEENLGFANGNNIGFNYAKKYLEPNIIILANNDLIFNQTDFLQKLIDSYNINKFDVAGPKIISLIDGKNQNPVPQIYKDLNQVKQRIFKFRILLYSNYLGLDLLLGKILGKKIEEISTNYSGSIQLHGACLIFGEKYILNYNGLFSGTFMYGEESILRYIIEKDKLHMRYIEEIIVFHKEGSSTKAVYGKGKGKRRFYYKWNLESCIHLKNLMIDKSIFFIR